MLRGPDGLRTQQPERYVTGAAYTSDLAAANTPPPSMERRKRARPLLKNTSDKTRQLRLVASEREPEDSMSPSTFKEARYSCSVCGTRSIGPVHPLCEARGFNGKR